MKKVTETSFLLLSVTFYTEHMNYHCLGTA